MIHFVSKIGPKGNPAAEHRRRKRNGGCVARRAGARGQGDDSGAIAAVEKTGADLLEGGLAALHRALENSNTRFAGDPAMAKPLRDPLFYDPDWEKGARPDAWPAMYGLVGVERGK